MPMKCPSERRVTTAHKTDGRLSIRVVESMMTARRYDELGLANANLDDYAHCAHS